MNRFLTPALLAMLCLATPAAAQSDWEEKTYQRWSKPEAAAARLENKEMAFFFPRAGAPGRPLLAEGDDEVELIVAPDLFKGRMLAPPSHPLRFTFGVAPLKRDGQLVF